MSWLARNQGWIYLTVGVLVLIGSCLIAGIRRDPELIGAGVAVAALWPFLLCLGIVAAPCFGLYLLGTRSHRARQDRIAQMERELGYEDAS